ncbi:hypothetical protein NDI44_26325 [Trichocoleus sp. DQ-A3]|uniref:hypothetical protein n=1 Tax=Cyanophyceae TaxID=3028117 RepID=UPI0016829728|nr:hypothetical protein [Coleofasciculus sp. FACHB-125]MBD1902302.1 hypothetical protein [Coleofasciculus sp. FACHB-125]
MEPDNTVPGKEILAKAQSLLAEVKPMQVICLVAFAWVQLEMELAEKCLWQDCLGFKLNIK